MAATVSQLWRYPVKSMVGEQVDSAHLVAAGLEGDRAWAVRDEVRGGIRGAKKIGALMQLSARSIDGGQVEITLPDGSVVVSSDPSVHARVSAALDHQVTLWPLQPAADLDHYRRGAPDSDDLMVELNSIFGRENGEPLPDFSIFPPEIMEFESPPGTYLDAFPLLIMTTSSLRALQASLPDAAIDVRRFRPNIVLDVDADGHPEFGWSGQALHIGSAVVRVVAPCPRCVMVTRPTAGLPEDRSVLRTIVRELDQNLGIYATIEKMGEVRLGDSVRLTV
jgi:uncharacterized protein YcbX